MIHPAPPNFYPHHHRQRPLAVLRLSSCGLLGTGEEEKRRFVATPVRKTTEIKRLTKRERENTLPHSVETHTPRQPRKNTLSCTKKGAHHSTHGHSGWTPLLGLWFTTLSVPLEWDSRILASIYVPFSFENNMAFSNKERNAALIGQGWEVTRKVNWGQMRSRTKWS